MKSGRYRTRRIICFLAALLSVGGYLILNPASYQPEITHVENASASNSVLDSSSSSAPLSSEEASSRNVVNSTTTSPQFSDAPLASAVLETLAIKGRAPKTGYARTEFYNTWPTIDGCNLRQKIIRREVGDSAQMDGCDVIGGTFTEPYTGETRTYTTKSEFSKGIQIDHIVALSDAWQKGAQNLTKDERYALATDPLNLVAADASENQKKSDGDAATWLPPNKSFRCQYVARQVSVKSKYTLWVTQAEHDAIARILETCPDERAAGV